MRRTRSARIHGLVIGLFALAILPTRVDAAVVVVQDLGTLGIGSTGGFAHFTFILNAGQLSGDGQAIQFNVNSDSKIDAASTSINLLGLIGINNFQFKLVDSTFAPIADSILSGGTRVLSYAGLTNGSTYGFLFTGNVSGVFGGVYAGTYAVSAIPLPPAVWLFLSALIGLVGVVRHKRQRTNAIASHAQVAPPAAQREAYWFGSRHARLS